MAQQSFAMLHLDPEHTSCIGGRTVLTCRSCAGNAPRGSVCGSCDGRGFNIFVCAHCNPAAAAAAVRNATASSYTTTPASSMSSTPASLSRRPSTTLSPRNELRTARPWKPVGDRGDGGGRIGTNTSAPRNL